MLTLASLAGYIAWTLVAVAAAIWSRRRGGLVLPLLAAGILAFAWFLILTRHHDAGRRPIHRARAEVHRLLDEPNRSLIQHPGSSFDAPPVLDPWGKPYVITTRAGDNAVVSVRSFGPDAQEGTEDDIVAPAGQNRDGR